MRGVDRAHALVAAVLITGLLTGCGWFGSHKEASRSTSVFDVKPGECFATPKAIKTELADLSQTKCTDAHTQESYSVVAYTAVDGSDLSIYPGDDALSKFAQGRCAQDFLGYVGVSYLDSSLFFTYLLPSARGWEQDRDRNVICFVTTTGATLTASVKGSKE